MPLNRTRLTLFLRGFRLIRPLGSQLSTRWNMKSRTLTCIIAMTLFAALALPVQLAAQRTNGLIAFTQLTNGTDGPANVFIANPDGSNVQQVQLPPDDPQKPLAFLYGHR